jgi:hypothetical protein
VIQPVGIVFKGSGFYVTDNRSKSSTALPGKKESDAQESKPSSATPKVDSTDTPKPVDSKKSADTAD